MEPWRPERSEESLSSDGRNELSVAGSVLCKTALQEAETQTLLHKEKLKELRVSYKATLRDRLKDVCQTETK